MNFGPVPYLQEFCNNNRYLKLGTKIKKPWGLETQALVIIQMQTLTEDDCIRPSSFSAILKCHIRAIFLFIFIFRAQLLSKRDELNTLEFRNYYH